MVSVYNGSLVLKAEEKSLSKTATFLTSAIDPPHKRQIDVISVVQ